MRRLVTVSVTAAAVVATMLTPVGAAAAAANPVSNVLSSVDAMVAQAASATPDPSATASATDAAPTPTAASAAAEATGKTRGDIRPPVSVRVSPNPVNQYAAVTMTVATTPPAPGVKVAFQSYGTTRTASWRTLATKTTNAAGVASYTFDPSTSGALPVRAVNLASGIASKPVPITPRAKSR